MATPAAPGIEKFFLLFPRWRFAVVGTPLVATLSSMVLSTTERTPQIRAARVAGMSQKPNPTVNAVHRTVMQFGIVFQNRIQRGLVLTHNRFGTIVLVPVF
jgi:di/tricarboxylate transporter